VQQVHVGMVSSFISVTKHRDTRVSCGVSCPPSVIFTMCVTLPHADWPTDDHMGAACYAAKPFCAWQQAQGCMPHPSMA
jgi:hypothetical protein